MAGIESVELEDIVELVQLEVVLDCVGGVGFLGSKSKIIFKIIMFLALKLNFLFFSTKLFFTMRTKFTF